MYFGKATSVRIAVILNLFRQGYTVGLRRCCTVIRHLDAPSALFAAEIERQKF